MLTAPWWLPNLPWLKARLARRITERTGLECRLGSLIALGWDGRAHLRGLQLRRPERPTPLVDLPHVAAVVRWTALARGRLEITHLLIEGGRLEWSPPPAGASAPTPDETLETDETDATFTGADALAAADLLPARPAPGVDAPSSEDAGLLGRATSIASADRSGTPGTSVSGDPSVGAAPTATDGTAPSTPAAAPTSQPASTGPAPSRPVAPPSAPAAPWWGIERVQVSDFHMRWVHDSGPQAAEVASARLSIDLPLGPIASAADRVGMLRCENMRLVGRPWPSAITLPVNWDGTTLQVRHASVPVPGGEVSVSWGLVPSAPGLPLTGEASFESVRLDEVSRWLAPDSAPAVGVAEGQIRFAVPARRPGRLRTVGQGRLTDLVLPMRAWLEQAGMPGLATRWPAPHWAARAATMQFTSAAGLLRLEDATLSAEELTVRGLGTATPAGPSLAVRAYVPPGGADLLSHLSATWPPDRQLHPQLLPNSPWAYLDVGIQGSWGDPECVLWNKSWLLPDLRSEIRRLQGSPPPS